MAGGSSIVSVYNVSAENCWFEINGIVAKGKTIKTAKIGALIKLEYLYVEVINSKATPQKMIARN